MSLINKMLQDLDARGSHGGGHAEADIKSVVRPEPRVRTPVLAAALGAAILLAFAAVYGWRYLTRPAPAPVLPPVVVVPKLVQPAPIVVPAPVAVAAPATEPEADPAIVPEPVKAVAKAPRVPAMVKPKAVAIVAAPVPAGKQASAPQAAEGQYRAAIGQLQGGRVNEAIDTLERALKADPRHEAARQTLVGLLIEAGRPDEAMSLLRDGLALDLRQPSLAMLLARMQIERGASGVETLTKSLPAATGNADYHALLAGALQRDSRHAEAAEQYMAALRKAPQNGVWLMGLGISLQAEKRDGEAVEAFERAVQSGGLNAQLLSFVERKLQQLRK